jgi:hypothetical protein
MINKNIFINGKKHRGFSWSKLGNISEGRGDLGEEMPVLVYRLMQYTMLDVLSKKHGLEQANEYFRQAGHLAGTEFAKNAQDLKVDFNTFIDNLQKTLQDLKIGILRMESYDFATGRIVLTVAQDLDCSGLEPTNENICIFDEGFIAGILEAYTEKKYEVREVDCWANGDRICRFVGNVIA